MGMLGQGTRRRLRRCELRECIEGDRVALKILVTFAVDAEFAPWRKARKFVANGMKGVPTYLARIGDADVSVILTGVGPNAARTAMFDKCRSDASGERYFDFCISAGLAGALRSGYRIGEVIAAQAVISDGPERADFPFKGVSSSEKLVRIAEECGARHAPKFLTVNHIVGSVEEKARLAASADLVEMESFEVLTEAAAWGASGISIRAVSDLCEESLPLDFSPAIDEKGKVHSISVIGELARHPRALPGLIRFARRSRLAAGRLAEFLEVFVARLSELPDSLNEFRMEGVSAT
jgi:nucleoside phosphorylase